MAEETEDLRSGYLPVSRDEKNNFNINDVSKPTIYNSYIAKILMQRIFLGSLMRLILNVPLQQPAV